MTTDYFGDGASTSRPAASGQGADTSGRGGDATRRRDSRGTTGRSKAAPTANASRGMRRFLALPGGLFVGLEVICVAVGLSAIISGQPLFTLVGYLLTGIVVPVLWAGFYVRQKDLDMSDRKGDAPGLVRANQWMLRAGLPIALVCVFLAATAWAKG